jgi:hypothetical protein
LGELDPGNRRWVMVEGVLGIGIFLDFLLSVLGVSECGSCGLPRLDLDKRFWVLSLGV